MEERTSTEEMKCFEINRFRGIPLKSVWSKRVVDNANVSR